MTKRQQIFVREYTIDLNATRAAIAAGYSVKTAKAQASRLLTNVNVKGAIEKNVAERTEKLDISAEYVLKTIKETMDRCSQGVEVLDREGNSTGEWKFEPFAVLKGAELLGKYHRLFTERIEHSGTIEHVDLSGLSDAQLAKVEQIIESAIAYGHPR